ncbi:MAG: LysR family transcriptional regulator [Burkholderiaceae bacterium]|nr:LysR family transcriptional regulator [Burkholderiaceae bacterium]
MESTIDLSRIGAFVKVVQTGSFTRAAEALDTHKAQLSRLVSQLERELGVRLLERTTRSLSLTEAGREFHERSLVILAAVEDARLAMQEAQGEPRGTLRMTCGVEFGMLMVGRWINRYLALHPQVRVDAEMTGRVVDLVHEGFDLAIRVGDLPDSTLAARRLGTLAYGLYAAPAYLVRRPAPAQPTGLVDHDLLVFAAPSQRSHWQLQRGEQAQRVPLQPRLRSTNTFTIRDAAEAGLGIAALPRLIGEPLVADGRLQPVLPGWSLPEVPVHAVFASARFLSPKVRAFVDLALQALQAGG